MQENKWNMKSNKKLSKVVLIETPFLVQKGGEETRAYLHSKYNLGLLALGSYIKAHSDLDVILINMVRDQISEETLISQLYKDPPLVVGITLFSYNLSLAYRIISKIKQEFPQTHVCVGGAHVSVFPRETIQLDHIDSIVVGDGEQPFLHICKQVAERGCLDDGSLPPGVYTKGNLASGSKVTANTTKDLDALPIPDLTLLGNYKRYRDFLSGKVMALLTTSRGCPNVCHYCLSEKSRYRTFSVEHTIEIMKHYKRLGVDYIEFWDETFNVSKRRLDKFAEALLHADLGLTWAIRGATVKPVPLETLLRLKKTGLKIIQFGVETGNERLLKYLNKKITYTEIKEAFDTCHKVGIRTVANMMINIPNQTRDEIISDLRMLHEIKPTYLSVGPYNWAPGTTHYENALKDKTLASDFWRIHAANPVGADPVFHPENEVTPLEAEKIRDRFVFRYYFRPGSIYNYLKSLDLTEIKRAIEIALLMLKERMFLNREKSN
jgi:radical SAM superfamily enzyme YgiQ (UPF0313 family)